MYIRLSLFVWSIFVLTALVSLLIAARPSVAAETGDERIIGSSKAAIGDIQGFVVIKSVTPKGEIKCGGMLIDPQWVATTTACVEGYASIGGKPNITVAVGCQTNEPYICVDKNNTSVLFHQRRRELVGATRVVQYATAKLALIQIPRVVLGSGVGVFPVAAAGDLAAMSGAPSVLGMGDIANVSDVNKAKAPAVMKATVALTTDSACQTTYGSGYSSGLNGCLERTGAMLFCRDTGSPVIGNVAGQPIALGIMLSEKTLGTNESARCTATMRKMGYIDLTVPATRNWIRDTVRAGVKRPVVTRLDGLYGENATLTNDRAKDIDISAVFPTGIRIGATTSSVLSVSENGLVALGSGVNVSPKGFDLSRWRGAPLIVPFFADANTSGITLKAAIGDAGMDGRNAVWTAVDPLKRTVTITWEAIRPAWGVTALTLPQNTFQLVMQNMNNGDVKIVLNYGLLSWNIGEKNCADPCNYITAKRAQIGLSAGNGPVLLHPASGKVNQLDLIAAKGTAYSVIRAGKFGGWDANPAPVSTWTATMTPTASETPTVTETPNPFVLKKGAVGASFVLGLLQNGTLVTWGMNPEYQANIPPCCGSGITDIAVGTNFALALKGGAVYGWGANTKGQLKFPSQTKKSIVAVAAGGAHGLALSAKGLVYGWGDNAYKQASVPKGTKGVAGIAGGALHSLAYTKTGLVKAWGGNASGQTKIPTGLKNVVMVAGGLDHSLALKKNGSVVAWGGNAYGQATVPAIATNVKHISAGKQFSLAVKSDGTVFGWGDNTYKQLDITAEYSDIQTVAAGYTNTILGLRNGRVIVLGDQSNGVSVSRTPTKTATPTP